MTPPIPWVGFMAQEPEILLSILAQVEGAIRRAFAEGYRHGANDAAEKVVRAAYTGIDARLPAILNGGMFPPTTTANPQVDFRRSPPKVGLAEAPRQYRYGA